MAVSEEDAALARKYLDEGVEAYQANDFETARDKFRRSFNLKRSYDTAINLGNVELKLELYRDAVEHLDYAARHYPTAESQARKKKIERILEETRAYVGAVSITVDTPGAALFIDEQRVGTSPVSYLFFVEEGKHEVRAELEGDVVSAEFDAKKGETSAVSLKFEEDGRAPASGLDDKNEASFDAVPPGEPHRAKRNWTPAWILGGVTVATFGTSMVFRGLAGSSFAKKDDAQSNLSDYACAEGGMIPTSCQDVEMYGDRANRQATVADATLIAAGVLGAATVGYVLFTIGKDSSKEPSRAAVSIKPGGVSFLFSGKF